MSEGKKYESQESSTSSGVTNSRVVSNVPSLDDHDTRQPNLDVVNILCYGTLDHVTISYAGAIRTLFDSASRFHEVQLRSSEASIIVLTTTGQYAGLVCVEVCRVFSRVACENVQFQGFVDAEALKKSSKRQVMSSYELMVNLYGPLRAAARVGDTLMHEKYFLQAPLQGAWDHRYRYQNPQSSSVLGDLVDLGDVSSSHHTAATLNSSLLRSNPAGQDRLCDILPIVRLDPVDGELSVAEYLLTPLLPHQKSAIRFMQAIETTLSADQPSVGGILADQPGLGKSLTSLALIASGLPSQTPLSKGRFSSSTLVVVPASVTATWQDEVTSHFRPGELRIVMYVGSERRATLEVCEVPTIVLTSYDTLVSDWSSLDSPIFSSQWHRVVVDEAHFIRNRRTKRFRALHAVEARIRWCLTGTPIQNGIDDMSALLVFLRTAPYNVHGQYQRQITAPLRRGDIKGLHRLHQVMAKIMVRRTKEVLCLPERRDVLVKTTLSPLERGFYDVARRTTYVLINESLARGATSPSPRMLQSLLRQRQICCHGLDLLPTAVRAVFNRIFKIHKRLSSVDHNEELPTFCEVCSAEVTRNDLRSPSSRCIHIICASCMRAPSDLSEAQCPLCSAEDTASPKFSAPPLTLQEWMDDLQYRGPSSRISSLLSKLHEIREHTPTGHAPLKSVIFSSWTRLLYLVSLALTNANIEFARYDGTLTREEKQRVVSEFQTSSHITVLLISIGSGGVGLNLTAASCVHLLEPQWNPMVESQALDRVHRIGQTKPVTTYRYIAKDTFEESIQLLQAKKLELVDLSFDNKKKKDDGDDDDDDDDRQKRLKELRDVFR